MAIKSLDVQSLNIPFKQAFVHASAVRAMTETVLVTVTNGDGVQGIGEGCPRHYVTGETVRFDPALYQPASRPLNGIHISAGREAVGSRIRLYH